MRAALARKSGSAMKGYAKLSLGSLSVAVGDSVLVNEASDPETLATVVGIVGSPESIESSFVRVRWFYKPRELFITIPKAIGKHEVFDSDNLQNVSVLSISGKAQVVSFLDYFNMRSPGEQVYYCRAKYFCVQQELKPPLEEWWRGCVCDQPINPDLPFIECRLCCQLYHEACVCPTESEGIWACFKCT